MYNIIQETHREYAITEEDIREVEERFGIIFPQMLRKFYLEHNGDYIKSCIFTLDGNNYMVQDLHYIKVKN
ncbi:MAG: SMI1/KNR4 family protein, partial [Lachnospiraceae bacterium]|nr:SMI1/KNR4 family protein [Lachnospiraceae bacterium]